MNWPAWISAICAALAIAGAVISWWRGSLSRAAKEESERARDEAQRQLSAIEQIAEQMQGPEIWMEWVGDTGLMLKTRLDEAVITGLDVPEHSGFGAHKDAFPMTITAGIPGRLY